MSRHYPKRLQRLASQLSDAVSLMLGYAGHNGSVDRHHPTLERVREANQLLTLGIMAHEGREAKPAGWRQQLKQARPLSTMRTKAEVARVSRAVGLGKRGQRY